MGIPIVGVPKTIDNELSATEVTFGFDTSLRVATDAIDRLHTTAESYGRVMVIEVMGLDAGWIALHSGIAGGADVIPIPEIPFTIETVCKKLGERAATGKRFSLRCQQKWFSDPRQKFLAHISGRQLLRSICVSSWHIQGIRFPVADVTGRSQETYGLGRF
jgi:6-phosphofructokinase